MASSEREIPEGGTLEMRGWGRTPAGRRLRRKGTRVTEALGKGNNTRLPNPAKWKLSSEWWFPQIRPAHSPTKKRKTKTPQQKTNRVSLPGPAEEDEEILPAPAWPRRPRTAPAHGAQRAGSRGAAPASREALPAATPPRLHRRHRAGAPRQPPLSPGPEATAFPPDANARCGGRCQSPSQSEGGGLRASR